MDEDELSDDKMDHEDLDDNSPSSNRNRNGGKVRKDIGDTEPAAKKAKIKDLYKPPTNDELNDLKETENLFRSNLFKMQVS